MSSSRSSRAAFDLALADQVNDRKKRHGTSFPSVRRALDWYFERITVMQAPQGMHPRTHTAPDGSEAIVDVDGGRGGDLHETLTTITTIGQALERLHRDMRLSYRLLVANWRDGDSMQAMGKREGMSASTVSAEIGRAEAYLLAVLREAEVLR